MHVEHCRRFPHAVAKIKTNPNKYSSFARFRSWLHQHTQTWERTHAMSSTKATTSACGNWMWRQRQAAALSSPVPDIRIKTAERFSDRWRPSTKLRNTDLRSPRSGTQTTHWHRRSLLRTKALRDSSWASMDRSHHNPGKIFQYESSRSEGSSRESTDWLFASHSDVDVHVVSPSVTDVPLTVFHFPLLLCTNLEAKLAASRLPTHMSAFVWMAMSTSTLLDLWSTHQASSDTKDGSRVTNWHLTHKRTSWPATTLPSATPLATLFSTQMCKYLR